MTKTLALVLALVAVGPAIGQVFPIAPEGDVLSLCGFRPTVFVEREIAGAERFPTAKPRAIAKALTDNVRPRAPLGRLCKIAKE